MLKNLFTRKIEDDNNEDLMPRILPNKKKLNKAEYTHNKSLSNTEKNCKINYNKSKNKKNTTNNIYFNKCFNIYNEKSNNSLYTKDKTKQSNITLENLKFKINNLKLKYNSLPIRSKSKTISNHKNSCIKKDIQTTKSKLYKKDATELSKNKTKYNAIYINNLKDVQSEYTIAMNKLSDVKSKHIKLISECNIVNNSLLQQKIIMKENTQIFKKLLDEFKLLKIENENLESTVKEYKNLIKEKDSMSKEYNLKTEESIKNIEIKKKSITENDIKQLNLDFKNQNKKTKLIEEELKNYLNTLDNIIKDNKLKKIDYKSNLLIKKLNINNNNVFNN